MFQIPAFHPEDDLTPTELRYQRVDRILKEVGNELYRALKLHPSGFHSPHEMHSTIEEEFDEVWDEVKAYNLPKGRDTRPAMRAELIQLAAMAVRGILEVTDANRQSQPLPVKDVEATGKQSSEGLLLSRWPSNPRQG